MLICIFHEYQVTYLLILSETRCQHGLRKNYLVKSNQYHKNVHEVYVDIKRGFSCFSKELGKSIQFIKISL